MMVQGHDTLTSERFNQHLCYNEEIVEEPMEYYGPKPELLRDLPSEKKGFFGNLLRRSSDKAVEKKEKKSSGRFTNLFRKSSDDELRRSQGESSIDDVIIASSPSLSSPSPLKRSKDDIESDAYIQRLRQMDGRTDEEINALLASIVSEPKNDVSPNSRRKKNLVTSFFSTVSQALKEEFSVRRDDYVYPLPQYMPNDPREFTVSISAAPFFAAPPPETDMSFEELATFEPIYLGSGCCINNLPVKKYDGTPLPGNQTTCPICIAHFEKNEELKSLPCVHFYHKECIDRWLMVGHSCPVCKALVL